MAKKTKKQRLIDAAKDLNKTLGIEPPIDTEDTTIEVLSSKLLEAKTELLLPEDDIKSETEKVLEYLEMKHKEQLEENEEEEEDVPEEPEESEDEDEEEEEDEDEEDEEPAEEPEEVSDKELLEQVKKAGKRKTLLQIAMGDDRFAELEEKLPKLKSKDALQGAMIKVLEGDEEEEEKPKKKKKSSKKTSSKKKKKTDKKPAPKKGKGKSEFGSSLNSQAGQIDQLIIAAKGKKINIEKIAEKVDTTKSRVKSHVHHLISKRGIELETIQEDDNYFVTYK